MKDVVKAVMSVQPARAQGLPIALIQRDRDSKFAKSEAELKGLRVKVKPGAYRAPNTNAFVERFIQSIGQECLDRFVIFGKGHMDHLCREYLAHYHEELPHQSLDNAPLNTPKKRGRPSGKRGRIEEEIKALGKVACKQRLGGLLKSYGKVAAYR